MPLGRTRPTSPPVRWGPVLPPQPPSSTRPHSGFPEARQTKHPLRTPSAPPPPSAHHVSKSHVTLFQFIIILKTVKVLGPNCFHIPILIVFPKTTSHLHRTCSGDLMLNYSPIINAILRIYDPKFEKRLKT